LFQLLRNENAMRLMHFVHTPRHSGAEMLVYNLCKLHRAWGHECAIASFAPSQPEFSHYASDLEQMGVKLFFPELACKRFGRIRHYRNALSSFKADVIFAHSELPSLYGRFANGYGRRHTRFVTVMHSATNNDFSTGSLAIAERHTRFRLDHLVAVSDLAAHNYTKRHGDKIPVTTISNGIDLDRFSRVDRCAARRKLGLNDDARIALQVGRVSDVKQQLFSLSALRPFLEEGRMHLWFAGLTEDEDYEARLRQAINSWNLQEAVKLLGSRSDIPELLAAADIYLMPSRQEAHSVAMLEALASGVPILASDIPAFSFAHSYCGVRICVCDELEWRVAVRDLLNVSHGSRNMENHSIELTAEKYLALGHLKE
jgi:L-malate glycosyltransferase